MATEVVCGLTFRLLLPMCLTAGTSVRPSVGTGLAARRAGGMLRSPSSRLLPRCFPKKL